MGERIDMGRSNSQKFAAHEGARAADEFWGWRTLDAFGAQIAPNADAI